MSFVLLKLRFFHSFSMLLSALELSFITIFISFVFNCSLSAQQSLQEVPFINGTIIPLEPALSFLLSQMIVAFICTFIVLFHSIPFWLLIFPSSIVVEIGDLIGIDTCIIARAYEITGIGIHKNGLVQYWLIVLLKIAFEISLKISVFLEFVKLNISLWSLIQPLHVGIRINDIEWTFDLPYLAHSLINLGQFLDPFLNVLIDHRK